MLNAAIAPTASVATHRVQLHRLGRHVDDLGHLAEGCGGNGRDTRTPSLRVKESWSEPPSMVTYTTALESGRRLCTAAVRSRLADFAAGTPADSGGASRGRHSQHVLQRRKMLGRMGGDNVWLSMPCRYRAPGTAPAAVAPPLSHAARWRLLTGPHTGTHACTSVYSDSQAHR